MIAVACRWAVRLALALATLVTGYGVAGLVGGLVPANAGWRPPARGVTVYLESNGIHVGFVVPKVAAGVDWRPIAPARDLADPRYARFDHLAIGWGERAFYLGTPTWADVRPGTVAAAAIGGDAVLLHFEHVPAPVPGPYVTALRLRPAEYRRLAAFLLAHLRTGGKRYPGYGGYDVFRDARGHYSALHTCNAFAGDALRYAGVRVGIWTPFPSGVLTWH